MLHRTSFQPNCSFESRIFQSYLCYYLSANVQRPEQAEGSNYLFGLLRIDSRTFPATVLCVFGCRKQSERVDLRVLPSKIRDAPIGRLLLQQFKLGAVLSKW